jgi:outer membrane protein
VILSSAVSCNSDRRATCTPLQRSRCLEVSLIRKSFLLAGAAVLIRSTPSLAQDANDVRVRVGLGGQLEPEFIGSDHLDAGPLWDVDIARGDHPFRFEAPDDNFGIRLFDKNGFSAGPTANIESSRKDKEVGAPVGKVDTAIEVGAFAEYLPSETVRLRADLRKGVEGHHGVAGSIGADRIWRDGDRYVFSIGPRVLFSDAKYQRAYFGVDSAAALASGLPTYRPSGGIHALAATSGLSYQFNPRFGMFGYARYERPVGDAAKSPIVREYGSRNQLSAGIGLSYTFTVKR